MTAEVVREALRKRYSDRRRYSLIEEVGASTGPCVRRLDVVVFDCYSSNQFRIDGFEIKISKADLRRELQDPEKHAVFYDSIDYFTLACPKEVVEGMIDVIPPKWGIMIVGENGRTRYVRKPLALRDQMEHTVPRGFVASAIRAVLEKQPSEIEIRDAYKRGAREKEESMLRRREWLRDQETLERLKKLDEIENRFYLWGKSTEVMDAFERFNAIHPELIIGNIRQAVNAMSKLENWLTGKEKE